MAERKNMEITDKDLNLLIINMRSDIEKQKDVVCGLKELGDFLMNLAPP